MYFTMLTNVPFPRHHAQTFKGCWRGEGDARRAEHPQGGLPAFERGPRDHDSDATAHGGVLQPVLDQAMRVQSGATRQRGPVEFTAGHATTSLRVDTPNNTARRGGDGGGPVD